MNDGFTRTPTGVVGSRYFFPKPIIWVEGPTDIYFYEPLLGGKNCLIKPFHGSENATALVNGLIENDYEYPYAVILDGDYGILFRRRSVHRWVVILRRYSFENYLWEKFSLNRSCLKHAQCGEDIDAIGAELEEVELDLLKKLQELIELDVAARRSDPAPKALPDKVDVILRRADLPEICEVKVATIVSQVRPALDPNVIETAKRDVSKFLCDGNISWLLGGHILFGVIQRVFTRTSARVRGKKVMINDDGLTQLLSDMVWRCTPSAEHRRLRKKLISVVRELNAIG